MMTMHAPGLRLMTRPHLRRRTLWQHRMGWIRKYALPSAFLASSTDLQA